MRLRISHLTNYKYETPTTSISQMLRLTPRNHDSQYVMRWRIDVSTDCWLHQHEDAFGNITHPSRRKARFESSQYWWRVKSRHAIPRVSCAVPSSGSRRAFICATLR